MRIYAQPPNSQTPPAIAPKQLAAKGAMVDLHSMVNVCLHFLKQLDALGIVGRIGYVVGLSMWTLLCLPTTPVELAAGLSFPLVSSTAMSAVGNAKAVERLYRTA